MNSVRINSVRSRSHRFQFPLALLLLAGCNGPSDGPQTVDYGPEVSVDDINNALRSMSSDSQPTQTKVGAYVHFNTSDDISAGALNVVVGDTGQTITNRVETDESIVYDVVQTKVTYHQADNSNETLTTGFQIGFAKAAPVEASPADVDHLLAYAAEARSHFQLRDAPAPTPSPSPTPGDAATDPTPAPTRVTFHHLATWEDEAPAPTAVAGRSNCLGLANCQLKQRHVSYDIVVWNDAAGDRLHFEFTTSPDVPQTIGYQMAPTFTYIPGLIKSCVTQLVATADGQVVTKTLIKECQEVQDFVFEATP